MKETSLRIRLADRVIAFGLFLVLAVGSAAAQSDRRRSESNRTTRARVSTAALPGHKRAVSAFFGQLQGWTKQRPARRPKLVIALDVDGTCADLDPNPKTVRLKRGLIRQAKALQKDGVVVVFITGRAGSEIGSGPTQVYPELVDFQRYTDHGAMVRGAGRSAPPFPTNARVKESLAKLSSVQVALEKAITAQLVSSVGQAKAKKLLAGRLERKDLGLAIHWRGASSETVSRLKQATERAWAALPKKQHRGLSFAVFGNVTRQTPSRDGVELRIAGVTKGDALRDLAKRARLPLDGRERLIFIGDSGTDENGFSALREIFPKGSALGIRVDAQRDVKTAASARLKNPAAVLQFLSQMRRLLNDSVRRL